MTDALFIFKHFVIFKHTMADEGTRRTSNTELPSSAELNKILSIETQRPVPPSKTEKHYPDFQALVAPLEYLNLPSRLFTNETVNYTEAKDFKAFWIDSEKLE